MRTNNEDFSTKPVSSGKNLMQSLQAAVEAELAINPREKEFYIKECEGFELIIDIDGTRPKDILAAINEVYDVYQQDKGVTLKNMFMKENTHFSGKDVERLVRILASDLRAMIRVLDEMKSGGSLSSRNAG